jgi:SAM-dependent methyltransferase
VSQATYIHGTAPDEQRRLVELNRLTNGAFAAFLDVAPAGRLLDVGCGLGILTGELAALPAAPFVVGVELSATQIAAASRTPAARFVQGDAQRLPLADGAFDLAYARFLLEHVADPAGVLAEMRRVLVPGGRVAVLENDVTLSRLDPPCPTFERVWSEFVGLQRDLGGDALIGRRLYRLLRAADFREIELSVQPEVHWSGSAEWTAWVTNLIGNVESARQALIHSGRCAAEVIDAAVGELRTFIDRDDASAIFAWNRARAVRGR